MVKKQDTENAEPSVLRGKTIAVICYGSQGNAQAKCMRDSGLEMMIGIDLAGAAYEHS